MNLANDLLRKANGYIHQMPIQKEKKKKLIKEKAASASKGREYLDELGLPTTRQDIAIKHKCSPTKVRFLFDRYGDYRTVYKLIGVDKRTANHAKQVYFMNDGSVSTAQRLADHYDTSRSKIQRAYVVANKDYKLANAAIEASLR